MRDPARCTIVICTLAQTERRALIHRALRSVLQGNDCPTQILVVVNGSTYDPEVVASLGEYEAVEILQIESTGSPAAILAGRKAITTPYFGYLDDDDEYLPGAVDARVSALDRRPDATIAVGGGYRYIDGTDQLITHDLQLLEADPLGALFVRNWLASCGALYRTVLANVRYFDDLPRHIHWSWLAYLLATDQHVVCTVPTPTFRIHDTIGSASKSTTYLLTHVEVYQRMLNLARREDIRQILKRRLCQAWHDVSTHHLRNNEIKSAARAHLRSLAHPYGWRYLPYTRKLIGPTVLPARQAS